MMQANGMPGPLRSLSEAMNWYNMIEYVVHNSCVLDPSVIAVYKVPGNLAHQSCLPAG